MEIIVSTADVTMKNIIIRISMQSEKRRGTEVQNRVRKRKAVLIFLGLKELLPALGSQ